MTFKKYKISELGKVVTGKTPSTQNSDYWGGEFPFITIPDLNDLPYVKNSSRTLAQTGAMSIKGQLLPPNTVLMSCIATIGKCGITTKPSFTNQQINAVIPNNGIEPLFLFYLFRSLGAEMSKFGGGGTVYANISKSLFESIEVEIPDSRSIQCTIAEILFSLDSKIATNNALSKTLEDIAQTIFKSWFIDFDPVKAKMAGEKLAGMDAATAALFPDSMVESELGLISKDWGVIPFTEMFEILSGGTPKTSNAEYWNGDIPWFSVVDAPENGRCFFIKTVKCITSEGLDNSSAKLVRPGVTIISARGTVGKTAIVAVPSTFNQSCYGIEGHYGDFFTYLMLRNQITRLQNISHGGMFDTITRDTFSAIKAVKPSEEVMTSFETLVSPLFLEIRNLQFQGESLTLLRNSLLHRLISGELQIPEKMLAS